jgi:mannose-6-phosphate isomerase
LSASTNLSPKVPVRLAPSFHERVWGSRDLAPWFPEAGQRGGGELGEVWFTADPPLPILVKFLFTSANLSVQVHPDGPCGIGKTEMWHILRADPGARIALGFTRPVAAEELRRAAQSGEIETLLRWITVGAGETYFIPAGTVHAIGAGLAICEIQQNSDITYRLYDYGRPRQLHLDQGLAAADLDAWRHPGACPAEDLGDGWQRLAACEHFATDRAEISGKTSYRPGQAHSELLMCVEGRGKLNGEELRAGDVWLIPKGVAAVQLESASALRLLRTFVP